MKQNLTTSVDTADDRYLPGYSTGLREFGPRLVETRVAFSLYGTPIPLTFGARRLQGNIIWARELEEQHITQSINGITTTLYGYFGSFAVAFGIAGNADAANKVVNRVWADGNLIYDTVTSKRSTAPGVRFSFYDGSSTQVPDGVMESYEGVGEVPAYRGIMYMVFDQLPLAAFDNKIPSISIQLTDAASLAESNTEIVSLDANGSEGIRFDDALQRAYVLNGEDILIYNMNTEEYINKYTIDAAESAYPGVSGVYSSWIYMPWSGEGFAMSNWPQIDATYMFFSPETGTVTHTITAEQSFDFVATQWWDSSNQSFTLIALSTVYTNLEFVAKKQGFSPYYLFELGTGVVDSQTPLVWGDNTDTSGIYLYAPSKTDVTSLNRIYLQSGSISNPQPTSLAPVVEDEWYPYDGAGTPVGIDQVLYFTTHKYVVIFYDNLEKVAIDLSGNVIWRIQAADAVPNPSSFMTTLDMTAHDYSGDLFLIFEDLTVHELNVKTGVVTEYPVTGSLHSSSASVSRADDSYFLTLADVTERLQKNNYKTGADSLPISTLVTQLALRSGYALSDINIDVGVDDTIDGAIFTETTSLSEILDKLKTVYGYDVFESGTELTVTNNSVDVTSAQHTVTDDDLLAADEETFMYRREEEVSLPAAIELTYINPAIGHQWATATADRNSVQGTNQSDNKLSITVPFIMGSDKAKLLAYRILYNAWSTRETYTFALPKSYIKLEPGDVIEGQVDDAVYTMRAVDVTYRSDYTLAVAAQSFQNFETYFISSFAGFSYTKAIEVDIRHYAVFLDVPNLRESDEAPPGMTTYYWQGLPWELTDTYVGGKGYASLLGLGNPLIEIGDTGTNALPWGDITHEVPFAKHGLENALNRDLTLNVAIRGGDVNFLQNETYAAAMAGANLCAIGHPGGWELVRFLDVTLELDGTYTFSNIIRGQYNTNEFARVFGEISFWFHNSGAQAGPTNVVSPGYVSSTRKGDRFIFLGDIDTVLRAELPILSTNSNSNGYYRINYVAVQFAVASKSSQVAPNTVQVGVTPHSSLPPAVGNSIKVTRNISDLEFNIYWNPSAMFGQPIGDGSPVVDKSGEYETNEFYIWITFPTNAAARNINKDDQFAVFTESPSNGYQYFLRPWRSIGNMRLENNHSNAGNSYEYLQSSQVGTPQRWGPFANDVSSYTFPVSFEEVVGGSPYLAGAHPDARLDFLWVAIVPVAKEELSEVVGSSYIHRQNSLTNPLQQTTTVEFRPDGRAQWHKVFIKDV